MSCAHILHMIPGYREKASALETEMVENRSTHRLQSGDAAATWPSAGSLARPRLISLDSLYPATPPELTLTGPSHGLLCRLEHIADPL